MAQDPFILGVDGDVGTDGFHWNGKSSIRPKGDPTRWTVESVIATLPALQEGIEPPSYEYLDLSVFQLPLQLLPEPPNTGGHNWVLEELWETGVPGPRDDPDPNDMWLQGWHCTICDRWWHFESQDKIEDCPIEVAMDVMGL